MGGRRAFHRRGCVSGTAHTCRAMPCVAPLPTRSKGKALPLLLHRRASAPVVPRPQPLHKRTVRQVQAALSRRCKRRLSRTQPPVTCAQVSLQRSAATSPPRARSCCAAASCALQGQRNGACCRARVVVGRTRMIAVSGRARLWRWDGARCPRRVLQCSNSKHCAGAIYDCAMTCARSHLSETERQRHRERESTH